MARAAMVLMRGKDITRVGLKVEPVLGPEIAQATASAIWAQNRRVMFFPRIKIITAKRHIKKQVHWYFYAN